VNAPRPSDRRRSERVLLHVPVVVRTETMEGKRVQEETHTLVVSAHGGLLTLKMEVVPGQPMLLFNPKTGQEQKCRVVRVDNPPGGALAVAFEFETPAPNFWPVVFPPADWGAARSGDVSPGAQKERNR
jgi:hypothetical protein